MYFEYMYLRYHIFILHLCIHISYFCGRDSDTSINLPGDLFGADMFSPGEGGSNDKSDGPTELSSNPQVNGKALMYQQYLESKQKQEEEEKKQREKETKEK
jgi:hypothetical protein